MFYGLLGRGTRLWVRSMATQARGASTLEKKLDDVVITFAKRTALGRSKKGQLKDIPVDELMQALIKVSDNSADWFHRL